MRSSYWLRCSSLVSRLSSLVIARDERPKTKDQRLSSAAGLSLVEATIILAVISVLTAIMAPSVRGYVQTAQTSAAKNDCEEISAALTKFLVDVGDLWVLR